MIITWHIFVEKGGEGRRNKAIQKYNIGDFQHDLLEAFRHFTLHPDPNTALHEWREIFYQIADIHAPYRSRKI